MKLRGWGDVADLCIEAAIAELGPKKISLNIFSELNNF
jgi:hypothetical protein